MIKVGLTGGIGSGKSTVAEVFAKLGVPVYIADIEAKKMMNNDKELQKTLINWYGNEVIVSDEINRKFLAQIIFKDQNQLQKINNLVHPKVREDFLNWCKKYSHLPFVIEEAAILFESGSNLIMDKIIAVTAPLELKINRVMKRDNVLTDKVLDRMKMQMSDEEKMKLSDFVINNDEKILILPQILEICEQLNKLNFQNQ